MIFYISYEISKIMQYSYNVGYYFYNTVSWR